MMNTMVTNMPIHKVYGRPNNIGRYTPFGISKGVKTAIAKITASALITRSFFFISYGLLVILAGKAFYPQNADYIILVI